MTFKIKMEVKDYIEVDGEYKRITAHKVFTCKNWDDFQNLFYSLVESSVDDLTTTISIKEDE